MKTILAITHVDEDIQIEEVSRNAKRNNVKIIPICTNTISFENVALIQNGRKPYLLMDGKRINPSGIWFATYPREDTLFHSKMSRYEFPGEYRSAVLQFITDLRFSFEELRSYPGSFENILRADSKLSLFSLAKSVGLKIPPLTMNSNLKTKKGLNTSKLYRKKLGFPSIVSYSRSSKEECVVTTTNGLTTKNSSCLLWQWQSPIESIAHVRGILVGDQGWFVEWNRKSETKSLVDFREANQKDDNTWLETNVPKNILLKLNKLVITLGLSLCCPEFLITPSGEWILIDLNPCGDWHGFFPEQRRVEIIQKITSLF